MALWRIPRNILQEEERQRKACEAAIEAAECPRLQLIICGGRSYEDETLVYQILDYLNLRRGGIRQIIEGGTPGAAEMAMHWCNERGREHVRGWFDWSKLPYAGEQIDPLAIIPQRPSGIIAFPGGSEVDRILRLAREHGVCTWLPSIAWNMSGEETLHKSCTSKFAAVSKSDVSHWCRWRESNPHSVARTGF